MNAYETDKLAQELKGTLPRHVGIIMDGNGRWAKARGQLRVMGHRAGTERLRGIIRLSSDLGIEALSAYAFSTENWKRPQDEINALFVIFMEYFMNELKELHANNVRICAIGERARLPQNVRSSLEEAETLTQSNTGLRLNVALNYGSRDEVVHAAKNLAHMASTGEIAIEQIDEKTLMQALYTGNSPDVDLIIRTGGDMRLSNFMLLQAAYAELKFVDDYWPDFNDEKYAEVLREFSHRQRRYGGLKE